MDLYQWNKNSLNYCTTRVYRRGLHWEGMCEALDARTKKTFEKTKKNKKNNKTNISRNIWGLGSPGPEFSQNIGFIGFFVFFGFFEVFWIWGFCLYTRVELWGNCCKELLNRGLGESKLPYCKTSSLKSMQQ